MSLYKRFRGHEPSPEALLKRADYYKSQYEFLFQNRGSNVSVFFIKRKRPSANKNRNAFDPKGSIIAGSFFIGKIIKRKSQN
jgi:hypothetical protein